MTKVENKNVKSGQKVNNIAKDARRVIFCQSGGYWLLGRLTKFAHICFHPIPQVYLEEPPVVSMRQTPYTREQLAYQRTSENQGNDNIIRSDER